MSITQDTPKNSEALITAAVEYWAKFLTDPVADIDPDAIPETGFMSFAVRARAHKIPTPEIVRKFQDTLSEMIREKIASGARHITLKTDYAPEGLLLEALQKSEAGGLANFLIKDQVSIDIDEGIVKQRRIRGSGKVLFSATDLSR